MKLIKTETKLNEMLKNKIFGSYGVYVSANGDTDFLHSYDVNFDTYFDIASMGKVLVTSTLILKAVSENRLSLNSTLKDFFDGIADGQKQNITVAQLLSHTSGILRYEIPQEIADMGGGAVAKFIIDTPLAFAPSTNMQYSCNGMLLLGYILEKLHRQPLEKIFDEQIKMPLGYTRSKFNIACGEPNAVVCYRLKDLSGLAHPFDDENIRVLKTSAGSGGQFFTMGDLVKFANAVMEKSEKLYSKEIFDLAEKDYAPTGAEGRGLGWLYVDGRYKQTGSLFPSGSFGHCGHTGTSMFFNREKNMYVLILTNATRFSAMKNGFKGYDYSETEKMRADIHNAIFEDLSKQNLI